MEIKGVSIDSRTVREGELFVAIRGDRFDGHDFVPEAIRKGAWGAVVERSALESKYGLMSGLQNVIPVEDTLLSLQEMSYMHRKKHAVPLVGVTGSNGKTTTKEMTAAILALRGPVLKNEGNLNNHIGVPLTLLKLAPHHRAAVIEMGMSAAGEIGTLTRLAMPTVGVVTNIGSAHLEFLGSTEAIARAKGELLQGLRSDAVAVLNADDRYLGLLRSLVPGRTITFGLGSGADVRAERIEPQKDLTDFRLLHDGRSVAVRLRAVGLHNVRNALAAASAAIALGAPLETVQAGLEEFRPSAMRTELRELEGRTVLADCYNANPESMQAALAALAEIGRGRRTIAVLGDMLELGEAAVEAHRALGAAVRAAGVGLLIAVGPLARQIAAAARQAGMTNGDVAEADSTARAAELLRGRSRPGDVVLIKGSRGMRLEKVLEEF